MLGDMTIFLVEEISKQSNEYKKRNNIAHKLINSFLGFN